MNILIHIFLFGLYILHILIIVYNLTKFQNPELSRARELSLKDLDGNVLSNIIQKMSVVIKEKREKVSCNQIWLQLTFPRASMITTDFWPGHT